MIAMTPENLRRLRELLGLSQTALARLIDMSGSTRISDWERGIHPIDTARWRLLLLKVGHRLIEQGLE